MLQSSILDAIAEVEKRKYEGDERIREGFAIKTELLGQYRGSTERGVLPLSGVKSVVREVSEPGTYLGVREGSVQEVGRVVNSAEGTDVYILRGPNFEPGHSPEISEHEVRGGTLCEAVRIAFLPDGTTTETSYTINTKMMVSRHRWSGTASTGQPVSSATDLE